jgi:DNA mismatch endonuclease (patch repair protein)
MPDEPAEVALPATSFASSPRVRRRMQSQRTQDTKPEMLLRRELHRLGVRFRLHTLIVPGTRRRVDICFPSARLAVMVDGCFWHGCPQHSSRAAKVNQWYWPEKIATNRARDSDTDDRLRNAGWEVVRVWEHDDPVVVASVIADRVRERRAELRPRANHSVRTLLDGGRS